MNFWKQQTHIMAYFSDNFRGDKRLPSSFMSGFLEVSLQRSMGHRPSIRGANESFDRAETRKDKCKKYQFCKYLSV